MPELKEYVSEKQKVFWQEKEIPDGRKIVISEEAADAWVGAHYGITDVQRAPQARPSSIPKSLHDKIKRHSIFEESKPLSYYQYNISPTKFNQITYPKDMKVVQ